MWQQYVGDLTIFQCVLFCFSAVLHLYFARFFCHFLHDEGFLGRREPFADLLTQGMVLGQSYLNTHTGKYLSRSQIDFTGMYIYMCVSVVGREATKEFS